MTSSTAWTWRLPWAGGFKVVVITAHDQFKPYPEEQLDPELLDNLAATQGQIELFDARRVPFDGRLSVNDTDKLLEIARTLLVEVHVMREISLAPSYLCASCGETDINKIRTVKVWTDYGYEYNLECLSCGADEITEDYDPIVKCLVDEVVRLQERVKELEGGE